MEIAQYSAKLIKKTRLQPHLLELHFTKPTGFTYTAGQFVQFHIPDDGKTILRSYSLSSCPTDDDIEFCVKLLPGGKASGHVDQMHEGDTLGFQGPRGRFTNTDTTPLVFVATGAGLAPVMGILRDELETKKNISAMRLLFGVRSEEDMFWIDRLDMLSKKYPNFSYTLTLSQPQSSWQGTSGRVTAHIEKNMIPKASYFLCGSIDMVKDVRQLLTDNGVDAKKIHFEIF